MTPDGTRPAVVAPVIGYYIHHQGRGHLHRAVSIAGALAELPGAPRVTGLSTLPKPAEWSGPWVHLARDDEASDPAHTTASGRLHWVPEDDEGLRSRMAMIAAWIGDAAPAVMVVDVSVEVTLLARLLGVRVVPVALPGERSDAPHTLGYDVAAVILAAWPPAAQGMLRGLSAANRAKVVPVGGISRFPAVDVAATRDVTATRDVPATPDVPATRDVPATPEVPVTQNAPAGAPSPVRHVVVLSGAGGSSLNAELLDAARRDAPGWEFTVLGADGLWVDDPRPFLLTADVVVTHAGQNAIAEVAALRRPAIVVPQARPHSEQVSTARVLATLPGLPALVLDEFPTSGWGELLERAASLDGRGWSTWVDGEGAQRAAEVLMAEVDAVSVRTLALATATEMDLSDSPALATHTVVIR